MKIVDISLADMEMKPTRDGYGDGLLALCRTRPDVVVLDADLAKSTRTIWVREKYPERFFDLGISEQDMLSTAAGLALSGLVPFVTTYGVFVAGRAWDQIRTSICYCNLNVVIGGAHGGVSVGPDGATHQALEEIAIMRAIPNMTVIVPADYHETQKATIAAADIQGPVYLRFGREPVPVVTTVTTPFTVGRAEIYRSGNDVGIIAAGAMVFEALMAARILAADGIQARVINCHTIKPLDRDTLLAVASECGALVTAEEHQINGGLGGAVAELMVREYPVPVEMVAVLDRFGESGQPDELMLTFGLTYKDIARAAKRAVERKTAYRETTG